MATLYQKYRPRNFREVVSQNHIKITLQNEIENKQLANAYLFSGPRGTGKTTMARVFSKALNCQNRKSDESEPCGDCDSCQQITVGSSLDIIEIDAASHTGVDNVRENIIANARIASGGDRYKVFIIDEVHMLSASAFNALLKILEEPPKKVIFILATTEVHKLPTTIISRCQRFDFKRINIKDIIQKLEYIISSEGIKAEEGVLAAIARQSDGHMRDAESLLGQILSVSGQDITKKHADLVMPHSNMAAVADLVDFLCKKDAGGAIYLVNKLVDEGTDLRQFNSDLIENLRRLMLAKVSAPLAEKFAQASEYDLAANLSLEKISTKELSEMIKVFMSAQNDLKTAFIAQLPLELAIINIVNAKSNLNFSATNFSVKKEQISEDSEQPAVRTKVDFQKVNDKWNEVLVKIKKYNHSLSFILRVCELRDRSGDLVLAFKYKFHQDRVDQGSIKEIMQKVFQEVYGTQLSFSTVLDESLAIANDIAPQPVFSSQPEVRTAVANEAPMENTEVSSEAQSEDAKPVLATEQPPVNETKEKQNLDNSNNDVDTILKMFGGKVVG